MTKVLIELELEEVASLSNLLDHVAPDHPLQKRWDELYLSLNNLPRGVHGVFNVRSIERFSRL